MSEVVRKHSPSNYALERYGQKAAEGWDVWFQLKDGFVSPEKALEYAANEKIEGQIRVVRVASPLYGGEVVTQKLYTLKKVGVVEKKTRKSRAVKDEEFNKALSDVLQKSQQTHQKLEKLEDPPAEIVLDGAGERQGPGEAGEAGEALPPDEGLNPDPDETV
jgi:hypothetical protein